MINVAAATGLQVPTALEWVTPVIDTSIGLLRTERGCLLARLWWEFDGYLKPQSLERFVSGNSDTATAWRAAIAKVFPQFPPQIGVARNITALRTVGWMLALTHHVRTKDALVREARWDDRSAYMGTELRDRTLGGRQQDFVLPADRKTAA